MTLSISIARHGTSIMAEIYRNVVLPSNLRESLMVTFKAMR